jgi:predicted enzyme related to lactoylglutathione lyase
MQTKGITWNAIVADEVAFDRTAEFFEKAFGLAPDVAFPGFAAFSIGRGQVFEIYGPTNVPDYGLNADGVIFGFRVEDIEAASAEVKAAGAELLGQVTRMDNGYAYRHFRAPDGKIYGLNEDPRNAHPVN